MAKATPVDDLREPLSLVSLETPVGVLRVVGSDRGLRAVLWPDDKPGRVALGAVVHRPHVVLESAVTQLDDYFAGERRSFELPLDLVGTEFQVAVWRSLLEIPYGQTHSYAEQARLIGRPTATRAVGAAIGRNPVSILLPCHRVLGSGGSLTGFAGGVEAKRWLLDHERIGGGYR
ncbi:MAG: methylated-DNA--[protein]-cysteine S-methyltransferase [Microthrixaceae bacterium]|nr:methylated-DNA--[protein]-cysteine S-methyltransferase [Microthrixaceae bacterium]